MEKFYSCQSATNYQKAFSRLEKNIRSGQFARYTLQKKQQIWNRICRYARQLGIKIKAPVAGACLAVGFSFAAPASAQTFVQRTGVANPFNTDSVRSAIPTFVDIDRDGDKDAFIGTYDGTIVYFKNTGTATAPVFTFQTGAANPLNGVDIGDLSAPTFVDIDADGDMDLVTGEYYGHILYYKNTGTSTAPVFVEQTGVANPLNAVAAYYLSIPTFTDIDGDGDMDLFVGEGYGRVLYYKNTGTATAPVFVEQTGAASPFNNVNNGYDSAPAFADIDGDGDKDALIGTKTGTIYYHKNTGTSTTPVFVSQTGANNPFDGVNPGTYSVPTFVDADGDGDMDVFIGIDAGSIDYFENTTSTLPLHLLSFSGSHKAGYNELQWQTANEVNTKTFEIERSTDGRTFTEIATLNSVGNTSGNYSVRDNVIYNGKIFYRLKMVDADGTFTYSQVIWLNSGRNALISIYPNPVTDIININVGESKILKTHAGIFDGNGRLMQSILIHADQQQINVQQLAKGVYLVKFADGTARSFIKK